MPRLSMSFLGTFQVWLDDREVNNFATDKVRALLAYLAIESGRPHRREALAALLWPDKPRRKALANLRQALARLRRALGQPQEGRPFLLVTRRTIAFNPECDHTLDVQVLVRHLAFSRQHPHRRVDQCKVCIDRLELAVALYRGEFLAGLSLRDSQPFEEWRLHQQELLHRQVMDALFSLTRYYEGRTQYPHALVYGRRQLALEPWSEEAHRQVMRLLALSGQRSAALAQYQACCRILAQEFGVQPEEATVALARRIRRGGQALEALRPPPSPP